jgi:arylsulfatase A-like enzyme
MRAPVFLLDALLLAPLAALHAADAPKPNLIVILADDLGYGDVGCYGATRIKTPNIDRLAREGMKFSDAHSPASVCSPSRYGLLSGRYPWRLHQTGNDYHLEQDRMNIALMLKSQGLARRPSASGSLATAKTGTSRPSTGRWVSKAKLREGRLVHALPVEELTLAEALREGGYRTANIGKWHLGSEPFSLPEHHGFEVNIGGNAHGAQGSYFFPYPGDWKIPTTGRCAVWNVLPDGKEGQYLTDRLTHEAVKFIRDAQATKNQDPATKKPGAAVFPLLPALRRPHAATGEKGSHREV